MIKSLVVLVSALGLAAGAPASAQKLPPVVLIDSTSKIAARPLNDTLMLVAIDAIGGPAPALISPIYDADGRTASGMATWRSGGSVVFTSSDCSTGAHVFSSGSPGLRATNQVQTADGVVLFVGAVGPPTTVTVRSILYGSGCSPVTVSQNGVVPVEATVNLTTAYPPPLSVQ